MKKHCNYGWEILNTIDNVFFFDNNHSLCI